MPWWMLVLIIVISLATGATLGVIWFAWRFQKGLNW